jgi:hypothetical protein
MFTDEDAVKTDDLTILIITNGTFKLCSSLKSS